VSEKDENTISSDETCKGLVVEVRLRSLIHYSSLFCWHRYIIKDLRAVAKTLYVNLGIKSLDKKFYTAVPFSHTFAASVLVRWGHHARGAGHTGVEGAGLFTRVAQH
jgi:hypothetical protein